MEKSEINLKSNPFLTPHEIKVVSNRPNPKFLLTPSFLSEEVLPKISKIVSLKSFFQKTIYEDEKVKIATKGAKCNSCELNKLGKSILINFVEELKLLTAENRREALKFLGEKAMVPIDQDWINLSTEEKTPFEYRVVDIKNLPNIRPITASSSNKTESELKQKRKILFQNFQGPGDIVMLTAAVRDLHINYPDVFIIDVKTSSMNIWEGNPYVEWFKGKPLNEKDQDVEVYKLGYPLIHQSNQGPYHFTEAFTEEIEEKLGVRIKKRLRKGDIHIRPEEDAWGWTERSTWFKEYGFDPNGEYWVIDAGHKLDFTAKFWGTKKFQSVVEHYKGKIQFVQIGHTAHVHPVLDGVINLIGKTDDRQLIRLIWASSGVLTPVSLPMVLAAAIPVKQGTCKGKLERPCVVVAGGREPSGWQAHTNHQFIHTCGCLPCCDRGGCWVSRTKPIGDGDEKDIKNMCLNVTVDDYGDEVPYCMHMITVDDVIRRIDMYNQFYTEDRKKYTFNKK